MATKVRAKTTYKPLKVEVFHKDTADAMSERAQLADLFNLPAKGELTPGLVFRIYLALRMKKAAQVASEKKLDRGQLQKLEKDLICPQADTVEALGKYFGEDFLEAMTTAVENFRCSRSANK